MKKKDTKQKNNKHGVDMEIFQTSNYSLFKLNESNRQYYTRHVGRFKTALARNNMIKYKPILVNSDMVVFDGKHRLQAAKELGLPVYYIIKPDATDQDMLDLGTQKAWSPKDDLHFWIKQGNREYVKFQELMEKYGASLPIVLYALPLIKGERTNKSALFHEGALVMPPAHEIEPILEYVYSMKKRLEENFPPIQKSFLGSGRFLRSLISFIRLDGVSKEVFDVNMNERYHQLRACSSAEEYKSIFKLIYNYKNRHPLE